MLITVGSVTQKYTYLILLSLLVLVSCSKSKKASHRKYLKANAEILGILNSKHTINDQEEHNIYHKIFKNYQGQNTYIAKKTPKNNPNSQKTSNLKKSDIIKNINIDDEQKIKTVAEQSNISIPKTPIQQLPKIETNSKSLKINPSNDNAIGTSPSDTNIPKIINNADTPNNNFN